MKILVIYQFGKGQVKDSDFLPRVGDKVGMFYQPLPSVTHVVVWPTKERLAELQADNLDIQAIITVA